MKTLEDWKKWVAHWITSGNNEIVCVQHLETFSFFDDKNNSLEYSVSLDEDNLPFIYFTKGQGANNYKTCTLSMESVTEDLGVKDAECLIAELDKTKPSRPTRYASREVNGMDVIDLVEHWDLSFAEANILKYLLRNKGEDISDLEKIIDYANRRIKQLNK